MVALFFLISTEKKLEQLVMAIKDNEYEQRRWHETSIKIIEERKEEKMGAD